jgi:hypothetical protein
MPISYIKARLEEESKVVPFTVFSIVVFWSTFSVMGGLLLWLYPQFTEANDTRQQMIEFKYEFARYRIEARLNQVDDEMFKLEREMERQRADGQPIPAIYYEQQQRLRKEKESLKRQLDLELTTEANRRKVVDEK